MDYVKQFKINGVDTKQIACIELHGKPNAATQGAVGVLGIDVDSPLHDVYKCVAVNGSIFTWELLSSGLSIMSATISGEGDESVQFPYANLRTPAMYVVKIGDLILDKEGYLYQIDSLNSTYCIATYCGTRIVGGVTNFITHEMGDSEELIMSQKGATAIKNELDATTLQLKSGAVNLPFSSARIVYGGGRFIALHYVSDNSYELAYSADGFSWTEAPDLLTVGNNHAVYGNGKFVILYFEDNPDADYDVARSWYTAYSEDGISWTKSDIILATSTTIHLGLGYGDGMFVACGYSRAFYSEDGIVWHETAPGHSDANSFSIAYGNGRFVAVSYASATSYSEDGITWTLGGTISDDGFDKGIIYGNGKFLAYDNDNTYYYSEDGITWTKATLPSDFSNSYYDPAFGNGKFVILNRNSNLAIYSEDGITWVETKHAFTNGALSPIYGNGKFIALGNGTNGVGEFSVDGVTWKQSGSWIEQNDVDVTDGIQRSLEIVNIVYPIGSIYMSVNSIDPSTLFGGTWERLKDRFLLGVGDTYAVETSGGEATKIYKDGNILPGSSVTVTNVTTGTDKYLGGAAWVQKYWNEGDYVITTRGNAAQLNPTIKYEQSVDNMPPYLAVYMWKRTA